MIANKFRVALFKEPIKSEPFEVWVAVCLEHYIAAQGATKEEALEGLEVTMWSQAWIDTKAGRVPFDAIAPAPPDCTERADEIVDFSVDYPLD